MTTSQPFDLRLPTPGCYNDPERAGLDAKSVFDGMTEHLFFTLGKLAPTASRHDLYMALSYAVRDRLMMRYLATTEAMRAHPQKSVAYLSAEFLIGPQLNSNLLNLGIQKEAEEAHKLFLITPIMKRGSVIVDVAIDQGGCVETSKPTTHAEPTYIVDDIVHYCVANMPGGVPRTSTLALNKATLPFLTKLANDGYHKALKDDHNFLAGLNVHKGQVTYKAVADVFGYDYLTAKEALN